MSRLGRVRFGIVGCGGAAVDFARGVAGTDTAVVVAAHDADETRARDLAARTGAAVHGSLRSLVRDPAVDAVYVALPHDRLVPTSVAALRAGRHVLVEKPAATTLRGLERLERVAAEAGRSVGVLFELRSTHAAREAAALVRGGAIGEIRSLRLRCLIDKPATYWASGPTGRAVDPWRASLRRAGGGVVLMNAIHQLDVVRAATGLEVEAVAARTTHGVPGVEVEDSAVAVLSLTGGVVGSLVAAAHSAGADRAEEIEIDGSAGALRIPDPYGPTRPLSLYLRRPWGPHPADSWIPIEGAAVDPWAATVDGFACAVLGGTPPVPGLADARAALATVLAIYRSAQRTRLEAVTRRGSRAASSGAGG